MKRHLPLLVPAAVAMVLIVLATIVQGVWTERWTASTSEELDAFATALRKVPKQIGDWETQETTEMDPREREAAGAVGDLSRTYRNPKTQEVVSVYMICGASRNVAIHTPDKCYTSSGFRMEDKNRPWAIRFGETTAEFRTAQFVKEDATSTQNLRVFWSWNSAGTWEAPEMPRMKYGGRTALNKIYFITRSPSGEAIESSPALDFAQEFLPVATRLLFPDLAIDMKAPSADKGGKKAQPPDAKGPESPPPAAKDGKPETAG
jgi:hypothetical protein